MTISFKGGPEPESSSIFTLKTERTLLRRYTGQNISTGEAEKLCTRIADHKWYLSERLRRDVGFRVAAVDYVENFYRPISGDLPENKISPYMRTIMRRANNAIRSYFESKGKSPAFL